MKKMSTQFLHRKLRRAAGILLASTGLLVMSETAHAQFPAPYCNFTLSNDLEPITLVNFAGINQASGNTVVTGATAANQGLTDYTAVIGQVAQGFTYPTIMKGNTNGSFTTYFTVYIDWNQDGDFVDANEVYQAGSVNTSTGLDAKEATGSITVPATATLGNTRMRVVKKFSSATTTPCASTYGAAQDFTITVVVPPCTSPTVTYTTVPNCATGQFSTNVNITNMGSATSIAIKEGATTLATATAAGSYVVGPFASGSTHTLLLENNVNALCNITSPAQTYFCPPANDEAAAAVALTVNADYNCGTTATGNTTGATASADAAPTCSATGINDDVWYSFVATGTAHRISFSNVTTGTMVAALYTGTPGSLSFVTGACASTTLNATGLTVGTTYYVRAYTSVATATTTTAFTICVGTLPPPPPNDNCAGAIAFPVIPTDGTCASMVANTQSATQSQTGCGGTADDDIWYSFVCPAGQTSLLFENTTVTGNADREIQFFSGSCGSLTSILCSDPETGTLTGLTPGQTYYFRIYTYSSATVTSVSVCLKAAPPMTYVSSTVTQPSSSSLVAGSTNQQIIRTVVVVSGINNPLNVTQLDYNTTGSTNAATDIATAKVYYTGSSTTFATTTPFGTAVANPNGTFTVTGTQALAGSATANTSNYFWLVYDINCSATTANVVDAQCTAVTVGTAQTPTATSPTGTRAITAQSFTATTTQPSTATVTSGATDQQVLRVALTGCPTSTVTAINFSTTGSTAPATDISNAKVYFTTTTTFATTTPFGTAVASPNGAFTVNGSQVLGGTTGYFWLVYDIAPGAVAANVVDASCVSAVTDGNTATPSTANPTGTRAIVAPPTNDMPAGAITLTPGTACAATYSNANAITSANEPWISCKGTQPIGAQVWFKFVAPASGFVKVSTDYASTALDTKIGLFSAANASDLATYTIIGCDDDGGVTTANSSSIYASGLTPGSTYYVAVAHYNAATSGAFCIDVKEVTSAMLASTGSCAAVQSVSGMLPAYNGWYSLIDAAGNLVAEVKQTAGTATDFTGAVTVVTGASRTDLLNQPYLNRNYLINATGATSANLKLYFSDAEVTSLGNALSTLNVSRVPGSTCSPNFAGTATVLSQSASNSANGISWVEVTTPGFSNFYIMANSVPLPVVLKSFSGKNDGAVNNLNWETTDEKNFSHFELQRSADGVHFSSLTRVEAGRNSTGSIYAYTDATPFEGVNIYRLKMVDNDGKSSLSEIVSLTAKGGKGMSVQVYPNPVKQELNISIAGKADGQGRIQVLDVTGKVVATVMMHGNTAQVAMQHLPAGMYLIKYADNSHSSVTKITKE